MTTTMTMQQMAQLMGSAYGSGPLPGVPVLLVKPGDTLVIEVDDFITSEQARYLKELWETSRIIPEGTRVVINEKRIRGPVAVIRDASLQH